MAHRIIGTFVAHAAEELRHLLLERLLQDQPRAQAPDPLQRIGLALDTGQHIIKLAAKPLARGYSRHAGVPPSASTRQVKAEATPALLSPGSWDGTKARATRKVALCRSEGLLASAGLRGCGATPT